MKKPKQRWAVHANLIDRRTGEITDYAVRHGQTKGQAAKLACDVLMNIDPANRHLRIRIASTRQEG